MDTKSTISRRHFSRNLITTIAGLAVVSGCQRRNYQESDSEENRVIRPPNLRQGDRIGLIAPASYAESDKIKKATANLESLGLRVEEGRYLRKQNGFVAGSDGERVEDLHTMFRREDIQGIWCVRGGYGTTRILDMLDYDLIRSHPKPFIGYSDITALHQAFYTQAGMVSFHGPVASSEFTDYSLEFIRKALFDSDYSYSVSPNSSPGEGEELFRVMHSGKATGPIVGGNLSLLSAICGTPYLPDLTGKIVFIEDIGEDSYRIDRMLVQLLQASELKRAAGIIFGNFTNCGPEEGSSDQTISEVIQGHFSSLDIPVVTGYSIGHIDHQVTLAIGMDAELEADSGIIRYLGH